MRLFLLLTEGPLRECRRACGRRRGRNCGDPRETAQRMTIRKSALTRRPSARVPQRYPTRTPTLRRAPAENQMIPSWSKIEPPGVVIAERRSGCCTPVDGRQNKSRSRGNLDHKLIYEEFVGKRMQPFWKVALKKRLTQSRRAELAETP